MTTSSIPIRISASPSRWLALAISRALERWALRRASEPCIAAALADRERHVIRWHDQVPQR